MDFKPNRMPQRKVRRIGRKSAAAAVLVVAVTPSAGSVAAATGSQALPAISADALVDRARQGETVDVTNADITGDLDLRGLHEVARPFRCRRCRFSGTVRLDDVVFDSHVDFGGANFADAVVADGATFAGPAQWGTDVGLPSLFAEDASFARTTFRDVADFAGADIRGVARFTAAGFQGDARFDGAGFGDAAWFDDVVFRGRASFDADSPSDTVDRAHSCFGADTTFWRARFSGVADFRRRCFSAVADFSDAEFAGPLEMRQSRFVGAARFTDARLVGGASFLGSTFECSTRFDAVTASGRLDFTGAAFRQYVSFFKLASSGSLVLRQTMFSEGPLAPCRGGDAQVQTRLVVNDLAVHRLSMDLRDVHRAGRAEDARLLRTIEDGARADGDIDTANKARYERQVLQGNRSGAVVRVLDFAFYRWGTGYFVRPLRPAAALAALVLVIALYRRAPHAQSAAGWGRRYFRKVEDGMSLAFRKSARNEDEDHAPLGRWIEYGAYKLLVVAVVLGVANSNGTLRQMLDAIK